MEQIGEISLRIENHPILGTFHEGGQMVTFTLDGKEMQGYEGEPIAAALRAAAEYSAWANPKPVCTKRATL